jgi:replicative DNA helicase
MIEKALLKVMEDHSLYDRWFSVIKKQSVTQETWTVLTDMGEYFAESGEDTLDWDAFGAWFCHVKHSSYKAETLDVYRAVFSQMPDYECEYTVQEISQALHEREVATQAAQVSSSIAEGGGEYSMSDLTAVLGTYQEKHSEVHTVTDDIDELSAFLTAYGMSWRLEELNVSIGPIGKGDLIGIAARPEVGKTTFLTSEISYMLGQCEGDIVWFANEEAGERVRWRIIQSITNRTTTEILSDKAGTMREYKAAGGERIKLISSPSMSFRDIRTALDRLNPSMIIYDQLRNVRGFERAGTDVERLKALYREARGLAVQYGPSLAVHQARGDAEGELYPLQHQLEGSQTEVQGALDAQIMIGRTHDPSYDEAARGLHIVKNKLTGGDRSDPSKRHCKWEVRIDADRGRYYGTMINPDIGGTT